MIVLVFNDRSRQTVTKEEAIKICSDPQIRGKIIDALTDDRGLQARLRTLMDKE